MFNQENLLKIRQQTIIIKVSYFNVFLKRVKTKNVFFIKFDQGLMQYNKIRKHF